MTDLASEHLVAIRDRVKEFVHGGLHLTSDDTASFVRRLNTVLEMVREVEDDNRVLVRAIAAREAGRPRLRLVTSSDGGAA